MNETGKRQKIKIKICGMTRIEHALGCAALGADALGFVFYPKSPRHLTDDQARAVIRQVPQGIQKFGVFVDEPFADIMRRVEYCGLTGVQLHGTEPPELIDRLMEQNLLVLKTLFIGKSPFLTDAEKYAASAYLVELGKGALPGGNARSWDYGEAKAFAANFPTVLAGGLNPDNVLEAVRSCAPFAVDVSSGVEQSPGIKDLEKVKRFISAVFEATQKPFSG
jgi:phosphoribosylanthranilate isomerase